MSIADKISLVAENMSKIYEAVQASAITEKAKIENGGPTSTTSLPEDITKIGDYAFCGRDTLKITELPDGVIDIGNYAFANCTKLDLSKLPDGVGHIGEHAFYGCESIKTLKLPKLKRLSNYKYTIGDYAFSKCVNLSTVDLSSCDKTAFNTGYPGIYSGEYMFSGCTSLSNVILAQDMSISRSMFSGCTGLETINLPTGVKHIDTNAFMNTGLTSIDLSYVTSIDHGAFQDCASLKSIIFPNINKSNSSEYVIYGPAFRGCTSLTSVELPAGLKYISNEFFADCTSLTTVTFKGTPVGMMQSGVADGEPFMNCPNLTTINVPWAEGEIAGAPWGAVNATINYNYTE